MIEETNLLLKILILFITIFSITDTIFLPHHIANGVEGGILEAAKQLDCKGVSLETANLRPRESW